MREPDLIDWFVMYAVIGVASVALVYLLAVAREMVRAVRQANRVRAAFMECGRTPPRFLRLFWRDLGRDYVRITYGGVGPFPHDPTAPMSQDQDASGECPEVAP